MVKQNMTNNEKDIEEFVNNYMDVLLNKSVKNQTKHIERLMWATPEQPTEFKGLTKYIQESKTMTNELTPNELLINLAGITYLYRDLLEAQSPNLKHKKKQLVNRLIVELNKDLNEIAKDRDVWQELDDLQQHFHDNFVRESLEKSN